MPRLCRAQVPRQAHAQAQAGCQLQPAAGGDRHLPGPAPPGPPLLIVRCSQEPSSGPKRGAGPAPKAAAKPAAKPASGGKAKAELVSKKAGAEAGVKKEPRVKREFGLPGQTRDTPDEARAPPPRTRPGGARPGGVRRRSNHAPSLHLLPGAGRPSAQVLHVAAAAATGERDGSAVVRAVRAAAAR